jgi:serine/threonine protein kinase
VIGKTVSHYQIVEKLGEGGMGMVSKALDTKLDRYVALKFLFPSLQTSAEQEARFIAEAKTASVLDHSNIGAIYAFQRMSRHDTAAICHRTAAEMHPEANEAYVNPFRSPPGFRILCIRIVIADHPAQRYSDRYRIALQAWPRLYQSQLAGTGKRAIHYRIEALCIFTNVQLCSHALKMK